MSSTLINVGTEPNDGTGDPPRTSFSKVNANFQAIDQALEATETTAQLDARDTANRARENHTGTQPPETIADFEAAAAAAAPVQSVAGRTGAVTLARADVGLGEVDNTSDAAKPLSTATEAALAQLATSTQDALDLKLEAAAIAAFETNAQLDSRDTANRNRANHTGTQPASTVSGLAAVATSGAYGDLSGPPTIPYGFTYDQQAEPSSPAAGATWRERSAGGLILGQWEWTGSLWLGVTRMADATPAQSRGTGFAVQTLTLGVFPTAINQSNIFIEKLWAYVLRDGAIEQDATNNATFEFSPQVFNGATGTVSNAAAIATLNTQNISFSSVFGYAEIPVGARLSANSTSIPVSLRIGRSVTGTPGGHGGHFGAVYRRAR